MDRPTERIMAYHREVAGHENELARIHGTEVFHDEYFREIPPRLAATLSKRASLMPGFSYAELPQFPWTGNDIAKVFSRLFEHSVERDEELKILRGKAELLSDVARRVNDLVKFADNEGS